MKAICDVLITKVTEKFSQRGEKYYTVDVTEETDQKMPDGTNWKRVWSDCYYPSVAGEENPKALEGYKVPVEFNFYPVIRTVGEKQYTDIKVSIIKLGK